MGVLIEKRCKKSLGDFFLKEFRRFFPKKEMSEISISLENSNMYLYKECYYICKRE